MPFDHHLGDAISNRGDPQRAHPAIALRYVDPPHRWRKVAARRQTIPKFIEVVFKISLKIRNHLAVYDSRPLVGSDPLIGFPHLPFRNVIRLGSIHEGPPVPVALWPEQNNATPSLQPHYRTFITTTGCSAPVPRIGTLTLIGSTYLDFSLSIGATGSRVPHRSLVQGHAAFTPDAAWAAIRPPPGSSRVNEIPPRFRHRLALFDASSAVRLRSSS